MLPNLRSVTWELDRKTIWRNSLQFLSRALVSVYITGDGRGAESWLASLLSYLPHYCPDVERIKILCTSGPLSNNIFDPIALCTGLRYFECIYNVPWKTALQLAQLSKIETLRFCPSQALELPPLSPFLSQSLTSLSINRLGLVGATSTSIVLQNCKFPALRTFVSRLSSDERPHIIIAALHSCCTPDLLNSVTLRDSLFQQFSLHDLRPLFGFHNLTDVGLYMRSQLGDGGIAEMARALPRLKKLYLAASTPSYTLLGLVPLVQHCLDLDTLQIELDGCRVPVSLEHRPGNGYCNPRIRTLTFGESQVDAEQCPKVAAFLSDLFPYLRKIEIAKDSPFRRSYTKGWEGVEGLLEIFAAVRMQERRYFVKILK